jgi:flagellar protein FliO/FliZ
MEETLRIALSLISIIGLILVVARFMKKRTGTRSEILKTLGYLNLGPKKGIAIIKAGEEILLVGITTNDLKLLKTLPESALENELKTVKDNIRQIKSFKELLVRK